MHERLAVSAAGLGCVLALACTRTPSPFLPPASLESLPVEVHARPVPLGEPETDLSAIGSFVYVGGLELSARSTDRLHGLSDLEVLGDRLIAVTDFGDLVEARLVLDAEQRLAGLADVHVRALPGEDGSPLPGKAEGDAEGLAVFPNGDLLVSFERHHRLLLYPAAGGPPRAVAPPGEVLESNRGLEALSADPAVAPDAYVVGVEGSGATWNCRVAAGCSAGPVVAKPDEFGLVGLKRLPGGETVYLLRAYDPLRGNRVSLQVFDGDTLVDRMDMARPMTIDNFEGVGVAPQDDGSVRFYLLSDDNANLTQRTLLLAFDWKR